MRKYLIALTVLAGVVILALFAGNGAMDSGKVLEVLSGGGNRIERQIIFQIRLPRILAAAVAGSAFAVSGYLLQENLNNVIASPGLLGINNGAGLFVLLSAIMFPYHTGMKCVMAFFGAIICAVLVSALSAGTGMSKTSVILSGVAISSLCSSVSQLIISLRPETVADKTVFFIGGFSSVPITAVKIAIPVSVIMLVVSLMTAGALDIIRLGDETALGLGLNVSLYRMLHIVVASVLSGAAVSMSGIIGFVGLMVPNFVRLFYRGKSGGSIIFCILTGASFMLLCDTAARIVVYPYEIPCGLILSALGTPFLIWMLVKKRKRLGAYD